MSVPYYGLLVLLVLLLHGQAAAETTIEEYDNYLLVQIVGSPQQATTGPTVAGNSLQQQELQGLREELHNLRMPQPGESPEQTRERKSRATALLVKIRQLEQQQKESTAAH
jgi:uncharacterized membrane protein